MGGRARRVLSWRIMAFLNAATRQLHVNIAYYGPALAGKTTNLRAIYDSTNPEARSD
jgi:hypothetical protein